MSVNIPEEKLNELAALAESAANTHVTVTCKHCDKELQITRQTLFRDNKLSFVITLTPGQLLQSSSLGKYILEVGNLLKASALNIGTKIDVLVTDVRFKDNEIAIEFISVEIPKKGKR